MQHSSSNHRVCNALAAAAAAAAAAHVQQTTSNTALGWHAHLYVNVATCLLLSAVAGDFAIWDVDITTEQLSDVQINK
jgi:hypothetical protein